MSATRRTALVLGGSGFIGSHLVPALTTTYDDVDILDLVPPATATPGTSLIGDLQVILPDLERYDTVFHLAARVGGRAELERDPLAVARNLALDVAFFDYVARTRPARAVYMSSSAIYPSPNNNDARDEDLGPIEESAVDATAASLGRPDGIYGWVKLTGEFLARATTERYDVPVTCYRPFTVYGPGQSIDYPIPAICARAFSRQDPIEVWGSGRQQRDFIHVDDAVAAIIASHCEATPLEPINVCTGVGTTLADVALIAAHAVGYDPTLHTDRSKPAGTSFRVGSPQRMNHWYQSRITLQTGLQRLLTIDQKQPP